MASSPPQKMASMLELPRELYLIICQYLTPLELASLAGVNRDHYVAVQQPLYSNIHITAFDKLVKLVGSLTKTPVVSNISAKQRLRWQTLSDRELRERTIKTLHVTLDSRMPTASNEKVNGMLLSRCISIVSRTSDAVNIHLALRGAWEPLLTQLRSQALPDVVNLVLCLTHADSISDKHWTSEAVWDLCFAGSTFPDLKEVEFETLFASPPERPDTMNEAAKVSRGRHLWDGAGGKFTPFYGLKKMTTIRLGFNDRLNAHVLESLFGSSIIPQKLTRLDISYCPSLRFVKDLTALSMLLQRGLQLLQHLKLHLNKLSTNWDWAQDEHQYCADITDHPENHLCNIVREAGQNIKTLDLALPYFCSRAFVPKPKHALVRPDLEYPTISREPYETLPERLVAAGYRYRRLISWHGTCRKTDEWDDIMGLASDQGEWVSWELVNADDKCASWHVSDCLPLTYKSRDVVKRRAQL